MRTFRLNKLIRNNILASMQAEGQQVHHRILSDEEYLQELHRKILEEAAEMSVSEPDQLLEEIADLQEVLDSILVAIGHTRAELEELQAQKAAKKGSFNDRIYIETVETPEGDPWLDYYASSPDRYPEVKV